MGGLESIPTVGWVVIGVVAVGLLIVIWRGNFTSLALWGGEKPGLSVRGNVPDEPAPKGAHMERVCSQEGGVHAMADDGGGASMKDVSALGDITTQARSRDEKK